MPTPPQGLTPEAWLALDATPGLGAQAARTLLQTFGTPGAALDAGRAALEPLVGRKIADALRSAHEGETAAKVNAAMAWLEAPDNHLLTLADEDYPPRLLETADPPFLLYLKGRRELLASPALAVVGSRNATGGGLQLAEAFSNVLSDAGLTIVSGLALGIDAAAHVGGLRGKGSTIAVVGTGLDLVYPARNRALAHRIAAEGLIVSEFSLGTPAMAGHFPRRNRIISGLSRGVLVVEATLNSGSLITARLAGEQGRDVFAIPGSIHSPFSKGCHALIKQGAKLVDDANDILTELGVGVVAEAPRATRSPSKRLPKESDPLLTALGFDPVSIDTLVEKSRLAAGDVMARLTQLELDGVVVSLPGGKVQRIG
jgi:DNA processing protein